MTGDGAEVRTMDFMDAIAGAGAIRLRGKRKQNEERTNQMTLESGTWDVSESARVPIDYRHEVIDKEQG